MINMHLIMAKLYSDPNKSHVFWTVYNSETTLHILWCDCCRFAHYNINPEMIHCSALLWHGSMFKIVVVKYHWITISLMLDISKYSIKPLYRCQTSHLLYDFVNSMLSYFLPSNSAINIPLMLIFFFDGFDSGISKHSVLDIIHTSFLRFFSLFLIWKRLSSSGILKGFTSSPLSKSNKTYTYSLLSLQGLSNDNFLSAHNWSVSASFININSKVKNMQFILFKRNVI